MFVRALRDLMNWEDELDRLLPLPAAQIAILEADNVVVDLESGQRWMVRDSWMDFSERWVVEIKRRGRLPSEEGLSEAIWRANGGEWGPTFCNAVAWKCFEVVMGKVDPVAGGVEGAGEAAQVG